MKTKAILLIALATVVGGTVLWLTPDILLAADTNSASHKTLYYTCPMHPSVRVNKPGDCPICGMTLQPVYEKTTGTNAPPVAASTNRPATTMPGCCSPGAGCR